jgi:hypothetical protein
MTHHHDHDHDVTSDLTFEEKLIKLLEHWLKHNHDHAHTYREWAERARTNDLSQVGTLIDEIGEMTQSIDGKIREALNSF